MAGTGGKLQAARAVELLRPHGAMRRIELGDAGVHPETLARLVEDGALTRVARGLYQLADAEITAPITIVDLIGNTRTDAGLRVKAELDTGTYPKGVTATDAEMDALSLHRNEFHGDWNYGPHPR